VHHNNFDIQLSKHIYKVQTQLLDAYAITQYLRCPLNRHMGEINCI
jgi:hypothetical protein